MREILSYSCAMPPTVFIITCLVGFLIFGAGFRIGLKMSVISIIMIYIFSTPAASIFLTKQLASQIPTQQDLTHAQAIVIPAVDVYWSNDNGLPDSVGKMTLERLEAAARLYHRLPLPIVVSGGGDTIEHPEGSVANLMQQELKEMFAVPVKFAEGNSHSTFENGLFTAQILKKFSMEKVIIVAQARDMPRLLWSFEKSGVSPIPYTVDEPSVSSLEFGDFLPSAKAFLECYYDIHELIGLQYYKAFY